MVLHGGHIAVNGRRSPESLYDFNLATYDEGDTFDQSASKGFVHVHGLSSKIAARRICAPATRSSDHRTGSTNEGSLWGGVSRWSRRCPCRPEQVDAFRLGAGPYDITASRRTPGAAPGGFAHERAA